MSETEEFQPHDAPLGIIPSEVIAALREWKEAMIKNSHARHHAHEWLRVQLDGSAEATPITDLINGTEVGKALLAEQKIVAARNKLRAVVEAWAGLKVY